MGVPNDRFAFTPSRSVHRAPRGPIFPASARPGERCGLTEFSGPLLARRLSVRGGIVAASRRSGLDCREQETIDAEEVAALVAESHQTVHPVGESAFIHRSPFSALFREEVQRICREAVRQQAGIDDGYGFHVYR